MNQRQGAFYLVFQFVVNVVLLGVDTSVLPGYCGDCRAYEKRIVGRVSVSPTRQNRSTGVT
ncbi:hypothetical protein, partial [Enterobacter hormaechei]